MVVTSCFLESPSVYLKAGHQQRGVPRPVPIGQCGRLIHHRFAVTNQAPHALQMAVGRGVVQGGARVEDSGNGRVGTSGVEH